MPAAIEVNSIDVIGGEHRRYYALLSQARDLDKLIDAINGTGFGRLWVSIAV